MGNLHSMQQRSRRSNSIYEKQALDISKPNTESVTIQNSSASLPPSPENSLKSNALCQNNDNKSTESYMINGRRYQNFNKKYILPFDEIEQDRLTQVHFLYKHLFGSNFSAPVKDLLSMKYARRDSTSSSQHQWIQETAPPRVLDIACGNGAWVLEMATEFPNSQFYGVDIVASYPTSIKPTNTFFSRCDILSPSGLPFPSEYFDYIHVRQVYTCFSEDDWENVVKEVKRLLKPGGYAEFRDIDPVMKNTGPSNKKFFENFPRLMKEKQGVNVLWARYMYDIIKDVGDLSEIHKITRQSRMNIPGPIGNMVQTSLRSALESYRLFFEKCHSIPNVDYSQLIDRVIQEAIQYNSYFEYSCCWGRKSLLSNQDFLHQNARDSLPSLGRKYSLIKSTDSFQRLSTSLSRNNSIASMKNDSLESKSNDAFRYVMNKRHSSLSPQFLPDHVAYLGTENVNDIDQFAEGYED